jgi:hypothetical protein
MIIAGNCFVLKRYIYQKGTEVTMNENDKEIIKKKEQDKQESTNKKHKKKIIILSTITALLLTIFIACAIYVSDYYHADNDAISKFKTEANITETYNVKKLDDIIVFEPEKAEAGFIFYPGGKVEYTAYTPLMEACASKGMLCALVEMPFNLAVLDMDAAEGIQEKYPEIDNWYIGGHSLGGSMAAAYLGDNAEDYEGLILLGSYSTEDLSDDNVTVLSIYGSEDKVLNYENYEKCETNLPEDYQEVIIEGGCHAYFGMYGAQDGDGTPAITNEEQICDTAKIIAQVMKTVN